VSTSTETEHGLESEFEHQAVPASHRKPLASVAAVWFGFPMILTCAVFGGILAALLGFQRALVAILIGNLILFLYVGALSYLSGESGLNFALVARAAAQSVATSSYATSRAVRAPSSPATAAIAPNDTGRAGSRSGARTAAAGLPGQSRWASRRWPRPTVTDAARATWLGVRAAHARPAPPAAAVRPRFGASPRPAAHACTSATQTSLVTHATWPQPSVLTRATRRSRREYVRL
jgi:hypothetical protein